MKNTLQTIRPIFLTIIAGVLMSSTCVAEPAPVYDAGDSNMFEPLAEQQQQDLPPPPAPEQDGTFVPMQREASQPQSQVQVQAQAPAPAQSQMREQDIGINEEPSPRLSTDQRLRRMEHIIKLIQSSEGTAQIDSLQNQVQALRAQVEQLTRQLQQMQTQQRTLSSDLEKPSGNTGNVPVGTIPENKTAAISASSKPFVLDEDSKLTKKPPVIKTNVAAVAPTTAPAVNNQPNVAEEQQIYQTAYNLIKAKKFAEAVTTLQTMLRKYPSGQFASNAHYWLGELYGVLGKNDQALSEFNIVVNDYNDSSRVSDAQLKLGLIYAAQLKWTDAKSAFKKVMRRYPGTTSARLASEQLKQIKQAGH